MFLSIYSVLQGIIHVFLLTDTMFTETIHRISDHQSFDVLRPHTTEEINEIFDEREQRGIWGYGVFYNTITGRREVVPQPIQELHNFIHIQVVVSCCRS